MLKTIKLAQLHASVDATTWYFSILFQINSNVALYYCSTATQYQWDTAALESNTWVRVPESRARFSSVVPKNTIKLSLSWTKAGHVGKCEDPKISNGVFLFPQWGKFFVQLATQAAEVDVDQPGANVWRPSLKTFGSSCWLAKKEPN